MSDRAIRINELMTESGVKFGTSGARGLAAEMTDEVCYAYTSAFIQYLEKNGELVKKSDIAVGGDLRPSTDRIMKAVARAVSDRGYRPLNCGKLPAPALAFYGLERSIPTVMVTGSHIPDDRNGIKYTKREGEILKGDEAGIKDQTVALPGQIFDSNGMFSVKVDAIVESPEASDLYTGRYMDYFPDNCLRGKKIGIYKHSAVGRDLLVRIFSGLGADVRSLGESDSFIPVDTEAIRPEDIEAAKEWATDYRFDSIISTDGDSDRPLISDEEGNWLRGDIAGILSSIYLKADAVVTPVSCNTALEKSGLFRKTYRTRIGSPYVIEGMKKALGNNDGTVVGYEANGGFLLGSDVQADGRILKALPTRDAVILLISVLLLSVEKGVPISGLIKELPPRVTFSNRIQNFPTERSKKILSELNTGNRAKDLQKLNDIFSGSFGKAASIDSTDGLRITFANNEIIHLRPSGNAPEFRCYTEADSEMRAKEMNRICIAIMEGWK